MRFEWMCGMSGQKGARGEKYSRFALHLWGGDPGTNLVKNMFLLLCFTRFASFFFSYHESSFCVDMVVFEGT